MLLAFEPRPLSDMTWFTDKIMNGLFLIVNNEQAELIEHRALENPQIRMEKCPQSLLIKFPKVRFKKKWLWLKKFALCADDIKRRGKWEHFKNFISAILLLLLLLLLLMMMLSAGKLLNKLCQSDKIEGMSLHQHILKQHEIRSVEAIFL